MRKTALQTRERNQQHGAPDSLAIDIRALYMCILYSTLFAVPLNNSHIKKTTKNNQIILASVGHVYPTND